MQELFKVQSMKTWHTPMQSPLAEMTMFRGLQLINIT